MSRIPVPRLKVLLSKKIRNKVVVNRRRKSEKDSEMKKY
jgi:hypothetical protein